MSTPSRNATTEEPSAPAPPAEISGSGAGPARWRRIGTGALGAALVAYGLARRSLGGAAIALVGGWLAYLSVRRRGRRDAPEASTGAPIAQRSVTVGKPADELPAFLRDPENLARIVGRVADVAPAGDDRYQWTVRGPLDRRVTWETRVVADDSGEHLRWESIDAGPLTPEWSASFHPAPDDRGTEVTVQLSLDPPGGSLGDAAVARFGVVLEPALGRVLDRFKSLAETGEIPTIERNPSARGRGDLL